MHIADDYVGLPFRHGGRDRTGIDCWGLVRLFLLEQAGIGMPRFDGCDTPATTIAHEKLRFQSVALAEARLFDVAICLEPVLERGRWSRQPIHMGVLVAPGRVLHITEGGTSRVDGAEGLDVADVRRVT